MADHPPARPVLLCVLDGWGWRAERQDNAAALADTPVWDRLWASAPRAFLKTSGSAVGLPDGQMGNSEVGHMNLGAGRVVLQDLPRIDRTVDDKGLGALPPFQHLVEQAKAGSGRVHLAGLVSPGGVHAHQRHIVALADALAEAGLEIWIHAITDGRDTPPKSARDFVDDFLQALPKGVGIATVCGRYFAMDRDKRWDRTERAYRALVRGEGHAAPDALSAIDAAYGAGQGDEFIEPSVIDGYAGVQEGDALIFANFRADRARQILTALLDPGFDGFDRGTPPAFSAALGMVEYSDALNALLPALFPAQMPENTLGEVLAAAGKTQLRIAETEKYPHVTFFFNGGRETELPGEERILVPSPKVATYDLQPEMSAPEVTDKLVSAIESGKYDTIIVNYANPDMVGHTGDIDAAKKAVETVDQCLGRVLDALHAAGGTALVTADHGNVELMRDPKTGNPHTAHTVFDVPVFLVDGPDGVVLSDGALCDVAPTMLHLMGLTPPEEMTGRVLLERARAGATA